MKGLSKMIFPSIMFVVSLIGMTIYMVFGSKSFPGPVVVAAILSWFNALLILEKISTKKTGAWLFIISFVIMYLLLVVSTSAYDIYIDNKLNSFDLNQDGFFSPEEQTEEQQKWLDLWAGDAGRTFIWITAILLSIVSSTALVSGRLLLRLIQLRGNI